MSVELKEYMAPRVDTRESREPARQPRVLCVAPAWNEGERIARVVRAVPDSVETTVVVDDGSTDDTADHAERAGATVVRSGGNRGVGAAIRSGIDHAIEHGYDIVVIVLGGGKTPPEQIPVFSIPSSKAKPSSRRVHDTFKAVSIFGCLGGASSAREGTRFFSRFSAGAG